MHFICIILYVLVHPFNKNIIDQFCLFDRYEKIDRLNRVFGTEAAKKDVYNDPDPTYQLTTDNVLKMLAIHMRFRYITQLLIE